MNQTGYVFLTCLVLASCFDSGGLSQETATGKSQQRIANQESKVFENFITTSGSKLMDGNEEFRFISFNVPTLLYVEDEMKFDVTNPYGLPSEFELRDLYESINQLGGRVVRAYTIPVRNRKFPADSITYVEAPGVFNEEAFRAMDLAIALAAEYKIRLVIPLVNNWEWMGGRPNYAEFRGKTKDEFWTDRQLIEDFKQTIKHVLTRVNTVNGIPYKDDPTILAWETGNELQNPAEWAIEICRYIKSLDSNHLLIDGYHAIHMEGHSDFVKQYSIDEPSIDMINTHHYEPNGSDTVKNLRETVELIGGKKPVFVGEFGFIGTPGVAEILDYILTEDRICGALIWSLRRHHKAGGFYYHSEPAGYGLYRAYHWPGFVGGNRYDERGLLQLLQKKAFQIQGMPVPRPKSPLAPRLLPFKSTPQFSWRGSAGASGYDIERSPSPSGPWELIAYNIDDINTPGFALFSDTTATVGKKTHYRVRARNSAGVSQPSNVEAIQVEYLTLVDEAENLMKLHRHKDVEVRTDSQRSFKEASSRIHGKPGSEMYYRVPGTLKEMRVYAFEKDETHVLTFSRSQTWKNFEEVNVATESYGSSEKNYDYLIPKKYTVRGDAIQKHDLIKLMFANVADIVRIEIDYQP